MKFLALDTSSAQCSVTLVLDDARIMREAATAREHAQLILPMVDAVLAEAGVTLRQLDGIAFGRGPGSFTGVRVAAAVTQGLALGADLPVLPVSSLRALAQQALRRARLVDAQGPGAPVNSGVVLACMDARMGEVYWAAYQVSAGALGAGMVEEAVAPAADVIARCPRPCLAAAGRGLAARPEIATALQLPADVQLGDAEPHAMDVASLAAADLAAGAKWLDATLAQPIYVRNQVASTKNRS